MYTNTSVLSPLVFATVTDVVTERGRESLMHEMFYANDLVLMSEIMEGLRIEEVLEMERSIGEQWAEGGLWEDKGSF